MIRILLFLWVFALFPFPLLADVITGPNLALRIATASEEAPPSAGIVLVASSTLQSGAIPTAYSFTVPSGSNRLLLLTMTGTNLGACVYKASYGVALMTLKLSCTGNGYGAFFYLTNPTAGTANIVIEQDSGTCGNVVAAAMTVWTGVDQTTTTGDGFCSEGEGLGDPLAYVVSTPTEGTIVTDWKEYETDPMSPSQTVIIADQSSYKARTGATTTMNWTSDAGVVDALQILPAP